MVAQRDFVCGCLGGSGKAGLEEAGWRPDPQAVAGGSSVGSWISHSSECRDGKSQAGECSALTSLDQKPALSQTSSRSSNLPVLKTLPIKWNGNCVLCNCRHGPGDLPVAAAVPLDQLSQLPEQRKLLEPYTLIKILSPHSAEER